MSQSSSAKLGEEAYGQGLANLAMALAKLRYEDTAFMEALAGIVCGSIERLSLVDVGQVVIILQPPHDLNVSLPRLS